MNSISPSIRESRVANGLVVILLVLWQLIRLPLLALLVILEPVVQFVLCGVALLGTLCAFFFKFTSVRAGAHFWLLLALSLGCLFVLWVYYLAIRLLRA